MTIQIKEEFPLLNLLDIEKKDSEIIFVKVPHNSNQSQHYGTRVVYMDELKYVRLENLVNDMIYNDIYKINIEEEPFKFVKYYDMSLIKDALQKRNKKSFLYNKLVNFTIAIITKENNLVDVEYFLE